MKAYLKSELFRIKKIRLFYYALIATLLTTFSMGIFFKSIANLQTFTMYGNHYLYACLMFLLVGFYLVYPLIITGNINKSLPLNFQILSNRIPAKNIYLADILLSNLIAMGYMLIYYLSSSLFARIIFKINNHLANESAYISEANYLKMMGILLVLVVTSLTLLYGIQSVTPNKIAATGLFIFISYIIPLIVAQLRMISPTIKVIGNCFPIIQAFTFYRGETSWLFFLLVNFIWIVLSLLLFQKKFVQQFI